MYETPWHKKDISSKRFLVTGGAGFIGSHLVEYLLKHNASEVRVLDDLSTGFISNISLFSENSRFNFIMGSIVDLDECRKACEGVDFVLHHAALGSVPRSIDNPIATHEVNANGFLNMLVAARDAKVDRFIYASSSSVYGDNTDSPKKEENVGRALSPYAVTKKLNEQYAAVFADLYGMNVIGFRYFNIFGPRQSPNGAYAAAIPLFIEGLLNNKPVYINGDGLQSRDFTFVSNVVKANMLALSAPADTVRGQVFNIAAGGSTSVIDIFNSLKKFSGSSLAPTFREERKGEIRNSCADVSKAKNAIGYSAEVESKKGLELTVEWFKSTI
ncbi:MAG: SDR family oxidoreductase [Bacteroidia bacterium]|nr:SDR family oxidoreductase [Bacteroidia bacterium]